jgi:outer membrane immunogenic protein
MKKLLLALATVTCVGPVHAADLALKASPLPPPPSWTGLYIGANGGWGWSNTNASETPFGVAAIGDIAPQSLSVATKGAVFGGQLGYNWQVSNWVLGVEGDYDGASINGSQQAVFNSLTGIAGSTNGYMVRDNINSLASIRGRLGYTWGPGLLYFTGGGAWENVQTDVMISGQTAPFINGVSGTGSFSNTRSGFVVGGGLEWQVARNWTVRAEYLYYDFNGGGTNQAVTLASCNTGPAGGFGPGGPPCGANAGNANNNTSVFRLGANYKVDWFR